MRKYLLISSCLLIFLVCSGIFVQKLLFASRNDSFEIKQDILPEKEEEKPEIEEEKPAKQMREFALLTMPKTGTHLVRPFLENLTNKLSVAWWSSVDYPKTYLYDKNLVNLFQLIPNSVQAYWLQTPMPNYSFNSILDNVKEDEDYLVSHAAFSKELEKILQERNCVTFFILRDPRDWVVSVIHHPTGAGVDLYGGEENEKFNSLETEEKIEYIIQGTRNFYSALETFQRFLPWLESPVCCPLRFEVLIGPEGGACTKEEHLAELRKIPDAIGMEISDEELLEIFNESAEEKINLVKGKAGTWKEYFNEDHKDIFKDKFGDLLIKLGYEKDDDW